MRKIVAILLQSLLPLQASWAAVAAYCQHERGAAARHLGHHEHQHDQASMAKEQSSAPSASSSSFSSADADCGLCHASGLMALLIEPGLTTAAASPPDLSTPMVLPPLWQPIDRPERPNWA